MNLTTLTREPINSVSDLMTWGDHLERLNNSTGPMLFRGQAELFQNLQPTLARAARNGDLPVNHQAVALLETSLLDGFRTHYSQVQGKSQDMPMNDDLIGKSKVEVLSLMQHYEVPSRLLDWSECVWTATYFACASSQQNDAELWFFDESILNLTPNDMPTAEVRKIVEESIGTAPPEYHKSWGMPYLAVVDPIRSSRLAAQKGKLTACVNAQSDHAGLATTPADQASKPEGIYRTQPSGFQEVIMALISNQVFRLLQDSSSGAYPTGIYRVVFDEPEINKTVWVRSAQGSKS